MERCQACQFWDRPDPKWWGSSPEWLAGGLCRSAKINEDGHPEPDALVYSYNEGGTFWTGPEFGCVHHQRKVLPEPSADPSARADALQRVWGVMELAPVTK